MPLPLILGIGATVAAGAAGVGTGIHGAVKMKDANDTMKAAERHHERNLRKFEEQKEATNRDIDVLGKLELEIRKSFEEFSNVFEKIQNRPRFEAYTKGDISIPEYDGEKLKEVSVGAGVLLGGIGGAAAGTAMLGVGLLVGGVIFNVTSSSLSEKADEAFSQSLREGEEIDRICSYMQDLSQAAGRYVESLSKVNEIYKTHLQHLKYMVNVEHKTNWNAYHTNERLSIENTVLLVGLLYNMCKVELVLQAQNENEMNAINYKEIDRSVAGAEQFLRDKGFTA